MADSAALNQLGRLTDDLSQRCDRRGGVRDPFDSITGLLPAVRQTGLGALLAEVLGPDAFVVRVILFDKHPDANWSVAWHRDETITVQQRADVDGFGPWSVKGGVHHVRPPRAVLDGMATLRLHIDDAPEHNGPLRVVPGSHRTTGEKRQNDPVRSMTASAGDVLVMRPALIHGSSKQASSGRRRVLHLECAAETLPEPLRWRRGPALELGSV